MSIQLQDMSGGPPSGVRFSSTLAVFQFAMLSIAVIVGVLIAGAAAFETIKLGNGRLILLGACVSLILPALLAAGLLSDAITHAGRERIRAASTRIKAVVALLGLSMALFLAASLQRETVVTRGLLDTQLENARVLFGLEDLSDVRLVTYARQEGKVEAEFAAAGQRVSIVVTPSPTATPAAPAATTPAPTAPAQMQP